MAAVTVADQVKARQEAGQASVVQVVAGGCGDSGTGTATRAGWRQSYYLCECRAGRWLIICRGAQ